MRVGTPPPTLAVSCTHMVLMQPLQTTSAIADSTSGRCAPSLRRAITRKPFFSSKGRPRPISKPLLKGRGVLCRRRRSSLGKTAHLQTSSWCGGRDARKTEACEGAWQPRSLRAAIAGATTPHQGRRKGVHCDVQGWRHDANGPSWTIDHLPWRGRGRPLSIAAFCT